MSTLGQVFNAERDIRQAKAGQQDLIYSTITGIKPDLTDVQLLPTRLHQVRGRSRVIQGSDAVANTSVFYQSQCQMNCIPYRLQSCKTVKSRILINALSAAFME